jgi:outer membrane protein assembly factor BamB
LGAVLCVKIWPAGAQADDWPQWLGPQRDGVWRETGILTKFPADGPKIRWRAKVGLGYAGPAVAKSRVYVADWILAKGEHLPSNPFYRVNLLGTERVLCLNEADGKLVWKHEYDCRYTISYAYGPRCTPLVHEGKVYTLGAEGNLYCLDAGKGTVVWSHDFKKEYGVKAPIWGFAGHPLLDGERLICMVGGKGSTVVAFNKDNGKEIWKALTAREPGYCPPTIVEAGGKRQLIAWHAESVNSLDPETGKENWSEPFQANFGMAIATPRQSGNQLFITSFMGRSMMVRLESGKTGHTVAWRGKPKTALYCTFATPFIEDGYIYGPCSQGEFRCIKADTGERVWETRVPTGSKRGENWGNAFVVKNGNRFLLENEKGDLIIAKLSPRGYEEISRTHLLVPTSSAGGRDVVWSHPAFANKSVYARNDKEIVCVSLAAE